jgi:hypothetical protein
MPHTYGQVRFAPCERHGAMYGSRGGDELKGRQLVQGGECGSHGLAGTEHSKEDARPGGTLHAQPGCASGLWYA